MANFRVSLRISMLVLSIALPTGLVSHGIALLVLKLCGVRANSVV